VATIFTELAGLLPETATPPLMTWGKWLAGSDDGVDQVPVNNSGATALEHQTVHARQYSKRAISCLAGYQVLLIQS
jgi:hypothetical protein